MSSSSNVTSNDCSKIEMKKYSYDLKDENIAKYPASPRGSSKLLAYDIPSETKSYHSNFSTSFPSLVQNCHLVFNDSRVLEARLFVHNENNAKLELMILDLGSLNVHQQCHDTCLLVMIRCVNVVEGNTYHIVDDNIKVKVEKVKGIWEEDEDSDGNGTECYVRIYSNQSIEDYLKSVGTVPIPPYLHRSSEDNDKDSYNNVYAHHAGSVAAPTAGLHFTKEVIQQIGPLNCSYLSLHVGAGTFKPVRVEDAREHEMHAESFTVPVYELRSILKALDQNKALVVVGTTSTRTLESLYWCGVKQLKEAQDPMNLLLGQFDWIALQNRNVSRKVALEALIEGLGDRDILQGKTSLMISPPSYEFKVVDHLVTNFHAPDSTLMLLVSAFCKDASGDIITNLYEHAQHKGYRFLSYGDVCLFTSRIKD